MSDAITSAVQLCNGPAALASILSLTSPAVYQWMAGTRQVPADRCPAIERATDGRVTVEQLRPDVVWCRVSDPDWPHPDGRPTIDVASPALAEARDAA